MVYSQPNIHDSYQYPVTHTRQYPVYDSSTYVVTRVFIQWFYPNFETYLCVNGRDTTSTRGETGARVTRYTRGTTGAAANDLTILYMFQAGEPQTHRSETRGREVPRAAVLGC